MGTNPENSSGHDNVCQQQSDTAIIKDEKSSTHQSSHTDKEDEPSKEGESSKEDEPSKEDESPIGDEPPIEDALPAYSALSEFQRSSLLSVASFAAAISPASTTTYYPAVTSLASDLQVSVTLINLSISTYQVSYEMALMYVTILTCSRVIRSSRVLLHR
jgi:hypothetical protein